MRTRSAVNRRPASARSSATPCPRPSTSCSANSRPPSRPPSTSECASSSRTRASRAMPRRRASTRGRREECCLAVLCFMFLKIIRKSQCAKIILFFATLSRKVGEVYNLRCEGSFLLFFAAGPSSRWNIPKNCKKT